MLRLLIIFIISLLISDKLLAVSSDADVGPKVGAGNGVVSKESDDIYKRIENIEKHIADLKSILESSYVCSDDMIADIPHGDEYSKIGKIMGDVSLDHIDGDDLVPHSNSHGKHSNKRDISRER